MSGIGSLWVLRSLVAGCCLAWCVYMGEGVEVGGWLLADWVGE